MTRNIHIRCNFLTEFYLDAGNVMKAREHGEIAKEILDKEKLRDMGHMVFDLGDSLLCFREDTPVDKNYSRSSLNCAAFVKKLSVE
jgi:hypothetical protein